MSKILSSPAAMIAVGVVAGGAVLYFFVSRASNTVKNAADALTTAVNPLDRDNIVARGVDAVGDVLDDGDDDDSFSLGSFIFDLFNPTFDPNAPVSDEDERLRNLHSISESIS